MARPAAELIEFVAKAIVEFPDEVGVREDGDLIELDVAAKTLTLRVDEAEIEARWKNWTPPEPHYQRGYGKMFLDHVTQANLGCDFDFLRTEFGAPPEEPEIN